MDCVQFIKNYAEVHGLPQPSARCGRADAPPIHLPAAQNYKTVHASYVKAAMERDPSQHVMQYRSFVDVWHKCIPEIQFMTPRTDVCAICEKFRCNIRTTTTESEKVSLTAVFLIILLRHRQNVSTTSTAAVHPHLPLHTTLLILQSSCLCHITLAKWGPCILRLGEKCNYLEYVAIQQKCSTITLLMNLKPSVKMEQNAMGPMQ